MNTNRVQLIGYVGNHLLSQKKDNNNKRIGIRIATHQSYKNEKGDMINLTVWHDVIAWEGMAEMAERSFVKGSKIMVEGSIEYRSYPDNTGHIRYITQIKAHSLMNLDR